jgi:hypothetical protein
VFLPSVKLRNIKAKDNSKKKLIQQIEVKIINLKQIFLKVKGKGVNL